MQWALLLGAYLAFNQLGQDVHNVTKSEWDSFKLKHGKTYEDERTDSLRKAVYAYNRKLVDDFNSVGSSFEVELNHMADLSKFDMKLRNGYRASESLAESNESMRNSPEAQKFLDEILADESVEVPDSVDWRTVPGRVTRVKDQGQCGSCWSFSSTGALEGQEAVRRSKFGGLRANSSAVELSEQNLVDCVPRTSCYVGGKMDKAFNYVKSAGGIDDELSYPYKGVKSECKFNKTHVAITDNGFAYLPEGDEQKLKEVVAKFGPVAVAIDASNFYFRLYKGGIYNDDKCKNDVLFLNHAILVVGYGTDKKTGQDFWIVKNSWSEKWGEQGYVRMARNKNNLCGIASAAIIPTF